ncbi:MAG: sugar phosphate isomerase/epimerase family protein [Bacteroidota bacterium]
MPRPVTLFTGQWADLPLETLAKKAASWGFDGLELACWGDHFDVQQALSDDSYCQGRHDLLAAHGLKVWSVSNHLAGQAVCDRIDERHASILPAHVWGDGDPEGVRQRAAKEMMDTARAAAKLGVKVVNGFTGSSIWPLLYSFPPVPPSMIDAGFQDFADRWHPILDVFDEVGVRFGLEVHPTEIAFDVSSTERALEALGHRETFGFNYDPSHFGYQGVDYLAFLDRFADRIYHVHMKDVWWSDVPTAAGVFGGHVEFGHRDRYWDFRSIGRGKINFEEIIRRLNRMGYDGPLSIEWEDGGMDREHGAEEACAKVRSYDFPPSATAFDSAFDKEKQ